MLRQWVVSLILAMLISSQTYAQNATFEEASSDFIRRYLHEWSAPQLNALAFMDQVYPDQVDFYGKVIKHAALMSLKRKFIFRWPERDYTIRPNSISVLCAGRVCTAEAIYDWRYRNAEATSSGTATLKLTLQDGTTIIAETGSVIKSAQAAALPPHPEPDKTLPLGDLAPKDIPLLRSDYEAHAQSEKLLTDWMERPRSFSGRGVYVDTIDDHSGGGTKGVTHTFHMQTDGGPVACIDPHVAAPLSAGKPINIHGVVALFILDVMFLNDCTLEPIAVE